MKVLFVVGAPGVGKTSMTRELFKLLDPMGTAFLLPKPKWTVATGCYAAAGHYTGDTFDGSDTVPYTAAMETLDELEAHHGAWAPKLVVFDGDRFSYEAALRRIALAFLPTNVAVLRLIAGEDVLAAHRAARGSNQNPSWMKGRATKSLRFANLATEAGLGRQLTFEVRPGDTPAGIADCALDFAGVR